MSRLNDQAWLQQLRKKIVILAKYKNATFKNRKKVDKKIPR